MNDYLEPLVARLEEEYDRDQGFIGRLRAGNFDQTAFERLMGTLRAIDLGDDDVVDRRLAQLLWYLPSIINWQEHRLSTSDAERLSQALDKVVASLERIIGVP